MSRILFASAAIAPGAAFAHVGSHNFDATGSLMHSVSHGNHAISLIAALALPVAAAFLLWKRFK